VAVAFTRRKERAAIVASDAAEAAAGEAQARPERESEPA
jgi:hypothetical protein